MLQETTRALALARDTLALFDDMLAPHKEAYKEAAGELEKSIRETKKRIAALETEVRQEAVEVYRQDPTGSKELLGGLVNVIEKSEPALDYDPSEATVWARENRPDLVTVEITVSLADVAAVQQMIAALVVAGNVAIRHDLDRAAYEALMLSKHRPAGQPGAVRPQFDARIASDLSALIGVGESGNEDTEELAPVAVGSDD